MLRFMNQPIAVISGASRGIGKAVALQLAGTHRIIALGRNQELLDHTASATRGRALCGDLSDPGYIEQVGAQVAQCDVLVNAAGVSVRGQVAELTSADWHRVFDANLFGLIELTRVLLPALRASRGDVVMLNSGAGLYTWPNSAAYCASKHALRAYTDVLRAEERSNGIRVISVHPGYVATDMAEQIAREAGLDLPRDEVIPVEEMARVIVDLLKIDRRATPEMISVRPTQELVM